VPPAEKAGRRGLFRRFPVPLSIAGSGGQRAGQGGRCRAEIKVHHLHKRVPMIGAFCSPERVGVADAKPPIRDVNHVRCSEHRRLVRGFHVESPAPTPRAPRRRPVERPGVSGGAHLTTDTVLGWWPIWAARWAVPSARDFKTERDRNTAGRRGNLRRRISCCPPFPVR